MVKTTFWNLTEQKQTRILEGCIREFASYSYDAASVNRIIADLDISKGAFYKYTDTKEALYLFLVEKTLHEMVSYQMSILDNTILDLFDRIELLIRASCEYYRKEEKRYQMVMRAFFDTSPDIKQKVMDIRREIVLKYQVEMLQGVDWTLYRYPKEEILNIYQIINTAIQAEQFLAISADIEVGELEHFVLSRFLLMKRALYEGILSEGEQL